MGLQRVFTQVLVVGLALAVISYEAEGSRRHLASNTGATVFDVTKNGAIGNGKKDNAQANLYKDMAISLPGRWSSNRADSRWKLSDREMIFAGPCKGFITFEVQGQLLGTTDVSEYQNGQWIQFQNIDGLLMTGNGTFNGQGASVWQYNDCKGKSLCKSLLPPSIVYSSVNNSIMEKVSLLNSKGFHMKLNDLSNFTVQGLNITAPGDSPNTDGIHISGSDTINIKDSTIGTGDDCISIGEGSVNVTISGIWCGPGHGISVGSLGYRKDDRNVSGIYVSNCTLTNTTNGARIKTWHESPPLTAKSIYFQGLFMRTVKNPIYIDQNYGSKGKKGASNVKISDIHFKNIWGTTISNNAISFLCSPAVPCEGIQVTDVDLALVAGTKNTTIASLCTNVASTFSGKISPLTCLASSSN